MATNDSEKNLSKNLSFKERLVLFQMKFLNLNNLSKWLLAFLIIFTIFIEAGFLYTATEPIDLSKDQRIIEIGANPGTDVKMTPERMAQSQVFLEPFIVTALIAMGVFGLFLMKRAPSFVDDKDKAVFNLILAIIVLGIAILALFIFYENKYELLNIFF